MTEQEFFQKELPIAKSLLVYFGGGQILKQIKKRIYKEPVPLYADAISTTINNFVYLGYFLYHASQADIDWKAEWETFTSDPDRWEKIKEIWKISLINNGSGMVASFIGKRILPSKEKHKWLHKHSWTRESMTYEQFPISSTKDLWGVAFASVSNAPLVEELLFRGTLLNGLREVLTDKEAVALSSLFFGLLHGGMAWPAVTKGALMTATLDIQHQNIFYSICEHYLNNSLSALALIANYYSTKTDGEKAEEKKNVPEKGPGKFLQSLSDKLEKKSENETFLLAVGLTEVTLGWSKLYPWLKQHWDQIESAE